MSANRAVRRVFRVRSRVSFSSPELTSIKKRRSLRGAAEYAGAIAVLVAMSMKEEKEMRDAAELREVSGILAELKGDQPARKAFTRGANTLLLARMVDNPDISQRLKRAYLAAFERWMINRRKSFR